MNLQEQLFLAVAFSNIKDLRRTHASGANLNGYFEDGQTPITEAILGGMGSPKVVRELIELGADPNRADKNGWTPWLACCSRLHDRVVKDEQEQIRAILVEYNADRRGEQLIELWRYADEGKRDEVKALLEQGVNPNSSLLCPLSVAVIGNHASIVELLLNHGANPDGSGNSGLTPLIHAASNGNLAIVKLLVEAGADPSYRVEGEGDAETYASEGEHSEVTAYLKAMKVDRRNEPSRGESPIPLASKFAEIFEHGTNAPNYRISTDDIVVRLEYWDKLYGIRISDVGSDRLVLHFKTLPEPLESLLSEICEFCPDLINQHFGCMDEMVETGQALDSEMAALVAGVDFGDENFAEHLLRKSLLTTKTIALWWD